MEMTALHGRSIEKDVFIKTTPARVFQALTEKATLQRWFLKRAEVHLCPGGTISFEWPSGVATTGRFLVFDPPYRLSYTWETLSPGATTVIFALMAQDHGTHLHLIHTGIGSGEDWDRYYHLRNNGWSIHLQNLTRWLETSKEALR
ncbi:MAG TPA: SRPBCC domain-containing protein [Ktedonobacteraceae bacterium]|jgi:uncharacterized protein YndB with AHSA1/START domain